MTTFIDYYLENHMDNITLFEKILLRTAKEYDYMRFINKTYSREKLMNYINSINISTDMIKTSNVIREIKLSKYDGLSVNINSVIYEMLKAQLKIFLSENKCLYEFIDNLANQTISTSFGKNCYTLNNYIDKLNKNGITPFVLIDKSFNYNKTKEGNDFWKDINYKYKIFLLNLLFNANINEEKANYF